MTPFQNDITNLISWILSPVRWVIGIVCYFKGHIRGNDDSMSSYHFCKRCGQQRHKTVYDKH